MSRRDGASATRSTSSTWRLENVEYLHTYIESFEPSVERIVELTLIPVMLDLIPEDQDVRLRHAAIDALLKIVQKQKESFLSDDGATTESRLFPKPLVKDMATSMVAVLKSGDAHLVARAAEALDCIASTNNDLHRLVFSHTTVDSVVGLLCVLPSADYIEKVTPLVIRLFWRPQSDKGFHALVLEVFAGMFLSEYSGDRPRLLRLIIPLVSKVLLESYDENELIQACCILTQCLKSNDPRWLSLEVVDAGIVPLFNRLLEHSQESVRVNATWCLMFIVLGGRRQSQQVMEHGVLDRIRLCLLSLNEDVVENSLAVLWYVVKHCKVRAVQALLDGEVVETVAGIKRRKGTRLPPAAGNLLASMIRRSSVEQERLIENLIE